MNQLKAIFLVLITSLLIACFRPPTVKTDLAFEDITDVSVRLIQKHKKDTIVKSVYEETRNLPGNVCTNLETIYSLNSNNRLGIAIRFWTKTITKQGETFYGPYPSLGLLNKIDSISILLSNNNREINISDLLQGDSTITSVVWRKYDEKRLPLSSYILNGGQEILYFNDVESFIKNLNERPDLIKGVNDYDYIFWFKKSDLDQINFTPSYLNINVFTSDSMNSSNKILTDRIELSSL